MDGWLTLPPLHKKEEIFGMQPTIAFVASADAPLEGFNTPNLALNHGFFPSLLLHQMRKLMWDQSL